MICKLYFTLAQERGGSKMIEKIYAAPMVLNVVIL